MSALARCGNRSTRFFTEFTLTRIAFKTDFYGNVVPDAAASFDPPEQILGKIEKNIRIDEQDRRDKTTYADVFISNEILKLQDRINDGSIEREVTALLDNGVYTLR